MGGVQLLHDFWIAYANAGGGEEVEYAHWVAVCLESFVTIVFCKHLKQSFSTLDTLVFGPVFLNGAHVDHVPYEESVVASKGGHSLVKVEFHPPHGSLVLEHKTADEGTHHQDQEKKCDLGILVHIQFSIIKQ